MALAKYLAGETEELSGEIEKPPKSKRSQHQERVHTGQTIK